MHSPISLSLDGGTGDLSSGFAVGAQRGTLRKRMRNTPGDGRVVAIKVS